MAARAGEGAGADCAARAAVFWGGGVAEFLLDYSIGIKDEEAYQIVHRSLRRGSDMVVVVVME